MLEHSLDDLARQELSPEEVRRVLERFSQAELGGSDTPTVGAVAEATGGSVAEIGAILAEVRGADFRDRFSAVLDDHEARLSRLEGKRVSTPRSDSAGFSLRPAAKPEGKPSHLAIALAVALAIIALLAAEEIGGLFGGRL